MDAEEMFRVEVAYARPERQAIVPVEVNAGVTAIEAVRQSGIDKQFPEIDIENSKLGIFGKKIKPDQELVAGDRVEIYRPLKADPKVVRRELAALGKTMGKKKKGKGQ